MIIQVMNVYNSEITFKSVRNISYTQSKNKTKNSNFRTFLLIYYVMIKLNLNYTFFFLHLRNNLRFPAGFCLLFPVNRSKVSIDRIPK